MKILGKHFKSLRTQLLFYFLLLSALPTIIVGLVAFDLTYKNNIDNVINYNSHLISSTANEIDTILERCTQISTLVASENIIQENLRVPLPEDKKERYAKELAVSEALYFINNYAMKDIFGIYVIGQNGGQYRSNSLSFSSDDINESQLYSQIVSSEKPLWFYTHGKSIAATVIDGDYFSVGQRIIDKSTGNVSGIVIVEIKADTLIRIIKASGIIPQGSFSIFDRENPVYSSTNNILDLRENAIVKKDNIYYTPDNKSYIVESEKLISGWDLISSIEMSKIRRESSSIALVIILLTLSVTIVAIIISLLISAKITRPLENLKREMQNVEKGDFTVRLKTNSNNEIGQLVTVFNNMLGTLDFQMKKIYENQNNLRKAHLQVLHSQIKPHFLYNTLDSIIWLARDGRTDDIIIMTTALVSLLRISLRNGFECVTIAEEITHVESYLTIQKIRYGENLQYEIDVPEELQHYYIPKFLLQPLVENSINHGIQKSHSIGKVLVTCVSEGEFLHFKVIDSGVGISNKRLAEINSMQYDLNSGSIGIKNVAQRLQLYFQSKAKIWLEQNPDKGCTANIILPIQEELEND